LDFEFCSAVSEGLTAACSCLTFFVELPRALFLTQLQEDEGVRPAEISESRRIHRKYYKLFLKKELAFFNYRYFDLMYQISI
jgi:hypothetical protein